MTPVNLLVVADPKSRHLSLLGQLPSETQRTISLGFGELKAAAPEADVIFNCTGKGEALKELLPVAPKLRWIHSLSAGVEHQLIPELIESPVPFTNARGVYKEALGEFAITAALFFAKDIRRLVRNQEAGRWEQFDVEEIRRKTMGIVGYGEIGRAAAQRGKAMGMRIFATRRKSSGADSDGLAERFYPLGERGDMIAESDVIVVSAPLTPETRGLVGEPEIQRMKSSAILINVGRGPVVDETALIRALEERRIRGAGLDVFDEEPLPAGHPFWRMDNVLLSPHSADHTSDWLEQGTQLFVDNFQRFVAGEPLLNIVDKRAGY